MRKTLAILCALMLPCAGTLAIAQDAPPMYPQPQQQTNPPLLTPAQLENLVAPIALYPDPLLGQVLAASTYPLEIIETQQWLNQNRGLQGQALVDAAKQQNWDPSVQALVAFPDAMALLSRDIQWTTDLGNAFLAQQPDVMNAIQSMRARAQQNGRLQSTPQETVTGQYNNGAGQIQIQPADPQVIYVPVYNPVYVWGPPAYGVYPPLYYPPVSYGYGFGFGVFLGGLFAGFLGFGGWGWGLSWLAHGLFLNGLFFHHFGFAGFGGSVARTWWSHDPVHRMGVAYPNRTVAARYAGAAGTRFAAGRFSNRAYAANRSYSGAGGWHNFSNNRGAAERGYGNAQRGYGNAERGYGNAERSFNARNYAAPRNNFSGESRAPMSNARNNSAARGFEGNRNSGGNNFRAAAPRANAGHFSAPKSSGHSGGGHSSGGHSGGGHSGGHSGGSHKH